MGRLETIFPAGDVSVFLEYDPDTGALTWLPRSPDHFDDGAVHSREHVCAVWNARYAGQPALQAMAHNGYRMGKLFNLTALAHRVCWALACGSWPSGQIDHLNGNRADNRLSNLREATASVNGKNQGFRACNRSGVAGVHWNKRCKKWHAQIGVNNSTVFLGLFDTIASAAAARQSAERKYGFHPNHCARSAR